MEYVVSSLNQPESEKGEISEGPEVSEEEEEGQREDERQRELPTQVHFLPPPPLPALPAQETWRETDPKMENWITIIKEHQHFVEEATRRLQAQLRGEETIEGENIEMPTPPPLP